MYGGGGNDDDETPSLNLTSLKSSVKHVTVIQKEVEESHKTGQYNEV